MNLDVAVIRKSGAMYCTDCDCLYSYADSYHGCPNCGNKFPHPLACMGKRKLEDKNEKNDLNDSSHTTLPHDHSYIHATEQSDNTNTSSGEKNNSVRPASISGNPFTANSGGGRSSGEANGIIVRVFNRFNAHGKHRKSQSSVI